MIAVDINQAALYAISKGWSLKAPTAGDFPFTIAELAAAAASYLEQVPPGVPEDLFYTMHVMLGFLPPECGKLFSKTWLVLIVLPLVLRLVPSSLLMLHE